MSSQDSKTDTWILDSKLREFRVWALTMGRYAPTSVKRAIRRIKNFSRIMNVMEPDIDAVLEYFAAQVQNGKKPQSLNRQRIDILAWCRFLSKELYFPRLKEPPCPDPWVPKDVEVDNIIAAAKHFSSDKGNSIRNQIIVELLFYGGLRIGELARINKDDVREDGIRVRSEKGEAERFIGLPDEVMVRIHDYVNFYRSPTDPASLFTSKSGRLGYNYTRNLMKRIGLKAGVQQFHAHAARHWNATSLLKGINGAPPLDIRMVQIHLGHVSLKSTQRYTHVTQAEVASEVRDRLNYAFRIEEEAEEIGGRAPEQSGRGGIRTLDHLLRRQVPYPD